MSDAFQHSFQDTPAFQFGEELEGGEVAHRNSRIPRWLLKFERVGRVIYLSDVGGEVEGNFYIPAVISVDVSPMLLDLERMSAPKMSATVNISPSSLHEHFIDVNELGQAKVTVHSWDGHTARRVVKADLQSLGYGYNGEPTSFQLTEDWAHNPIFPEKLVNYGGGQGFTKVQLDDLGSRFHAYTQVWGDAREVPCFVLMVVDDDTTRYMIAGHNVMNLPTGGDGAPLRYTDLVGGVYIGTEHFAPPVDCFYDFEDAQNVVTAADLVRKLINVHSGYKGNERNIARLTVMYNRLQNFSAAGYTDQEGPIFSLFAERLQREFMFILWEEGGLLTGTAITPGTPPVRTLVYGVHLLQLQDQVTEETRYTNFKTRYKYRSNGAAGAGWYGVQELNGGNSEYLKQSELRWGYRSFGDPVEFPRHANAIDLPDVESQATANGIVRRYARIFHRGQRARYLQLAEFADLPLGEMYRIVDPERGYTGIGKRALLIGREWVTPELIVNTYRTIEPFELSVAAASTVEIAPGNGVDGPPLTDSCIPTFGPGSGGEGSCWTITNGELVDLGGGIWGLQPIDVNLPVTAELSCDEACSCADGEEKVSWGCSFNGEFGVATGTVTPCGGGGSYFACAPCGGTTPGPTGYVRRWNRDSTNETGSLGTGPLTVTFQWYRQNLPSAVISQPFLHRGTITPDPGGFTGGTWGVCAIVDGPKFTVYGT